MKPRTFGVIALWILAAGAGRASTDTTNGRSLILGLHVGSCLTPSASSYFDAYHRTLGGEAAAFPALTGLRGSARIDFSPTFSVLLHVQSMTLSMDDAGDLVGTDTATGGSVILSQSTERWSIQTYPFLAGIRVTPVVSRFQSYCFAQAGMAITHFRWDHVTVGGSAASRTPTGTFERNTVTPTVAAGVGLDLVFDQFHERELLHGLTIEASYRWSQSSLAAFDPIAARSTSPRTEWRTVYPFNMSGFELWAGLQLQFYH